MAANASSTPIFLVALPRSGSTLVQRILSGHSEIASTAEPWLLLPLAGMTGEPGVAMYANYSHKGAVIAVRDLISAMPGRRSRYTEILRDAVLAMYQAASDRPCRYFLDKTPRYYLIVDFLRELFPESKIIFLVRHPLDVLASMLTTWGDDRLWVHNALTDLYEGPNFIHEASRRLAGTTYLLGYEKLVADPEATCRGLLEYLELDFEPAMLERIGDVRLEGRMGDRPTGDKLTAVQRDSVGRWRDVLGTVVRRAYARRYVQRLRPEVLATFGVERARLLAELDGLPVSWRRTAVDLAAVAVSHSSPWIAGNVVRDQWRRPKRSVRAKLD